MGNRRASHEPSLTQNFALGGRQRGKVIVRAARGFGYGAGDRLGADRLGGYSGSAWHRARLRRANYRQALRDKPEHRRKGEAEA